MRRAGSATAGVHGHESALATRTPRLGGRGPNVYCGTGRPARRSRAGSGCSAPLADGRPPADCCAWLSLGDAAFAGGDAVPRHVAVPTETAGTPNGRVPSASVSRQRPSAAKTTPNAYLAPPRDPRTAIRRSALPAAQQDRVPAMLPDLDAAPTITCHAPPVSTAQSLEDSTGVVPWPGRRRAERPSRHQDEAEGRASMSRVHPPRRRVLITAPEPYPLLNIIWTMLVFFGFVIWLAPSSCG